MTETTTIGVSSSHHYTPVAKILHWSILLLIVVQFLSAWLAPEVRHNQTPGFLISIHMSFGIVILVLMALRYVWRITHAIPPEDSSLPKWQRTLASLMHVGLYVILFALPFLGWAWASSRGWPVDVFGLFTLPSILAQGSSLGRVASLLHSGFAVLLIGLVGVHVLAALYHHYIIGDKVMEGMMPKKKSR